MLPLSIKHFLSLSSRQLPIESCKVHGWINQLSDGSCLKDLQIVFQEDSHILLDQVTKGACVEIMGDLVSSPAKGQSVELVGKDLKVLGPCPSEEYPLVKSRVPFDYLRDFGHLRSKTKTFGALWRIRNATIQGIHEYFSRHDFIQVHTPLLTGNDCEGGGEAFQLKDDKFFGKPTYLTVSGQLHLEMMAASHARVYTLNPAFRAEPSKSTRHLAEFWMLEAEMAFLQDLDSLLKSIQDMLSSVTQFVLDHVPQDMEFCHEFLDPTAKSLTKSLLEPFKIMSYTEAIQVLEKSRKTWEFPVQWGHALQSEHERYLAEVYCASPVFITEYPMDIKPFYMKSAPENSKTVQCTDLLVPRIGELVGGSLREDKYEILQQRLTKAGMDKESLDWYLDLRKFGSFPHGGYGMGFERYLSCITGMSNIKDMILAPRFLGHCNY